MRHLVFISYLLFVIGQPLSAQQKEASGLTGAKVDTTQKVITIPKSDCRQIIVDGNLNSSEWSNAIRISQPEDYSILIKADNDNIAVCLLFPKPMGSVVCEIRITSDDKEVYLLHSSGAMGEGVSGFPSTTRFNVNNNKLWISNFCIKDIEKEKEWIAAGKPIEKYDEIYNKRDGIEYKISREKIKGNIWKFTIGWVRVEIKDGKPDFRQHNYPVNASLSNSNNWIRLMLPD